MRWKKKLKLDFGLVCSVLSVVSSVISRVLNVFVIVVMRRFLEVKWFLFKEFENVGVEVLFVLVWILNCGLCMF